MTDWQIHVPHRGVDQPLDAQALWELPRQLDGEDRLVFQDVLDRCVLAGIRTMEPILLGIEAMGPEDRRRCLDACRRRAGLESATDIDGAKAFAMAQDIARRRTPSEEQPRLTPGGAIEIPLSEAELAALERKTNSPRSGSPSAVRTGSARRLSERQPRRDRMSAGNPVALGGRRRENRLCQHGLARSETRSGAPSAGPHPS